MMNNQNRAAVRLLACALLVSSLASCGNEPTEPAGKDTQASPADNAVVTEAAVTEEDTGEYKKPDKDFGGATFTIMDYKTEGGVWLAQNYSDIITEGKETGDLVNDAQYRRNLKVEESLNISLAVKEASPDNRGSGNGDLNKMINAGDNSIDAAIVYLTSMPALIADAGKLTDLSAVSTLNTSASWWDQNAVTEFTLGGQMKLLVGDLNLYNTFSPIMYFFNKNVANQYDLGNLYDLVRDGKWTNDKMMEFSKITAADLNGDGVMDENDRFGLAEQLNLLKHFITAGGQRFSSRDKDGNIILTLNTETTAGIVETIVPFLNDKKVCNAANHYKSKYSNVFRELHVPMLMNDQLLFNMNQLLIAFELRKMEADFGVLPCPKADEAQSFYSTPVETWWATCICIPEMCSRKEDTGYVLDAMGYYSQKLVTPAFVDKTVTSISLRDEDSEEMLHLIMDSRYYDVALIYDWGNYTQVVTTLGESGKTNFASAYEKAEKRILSALEKTMGQLNEQN